MRFHYLVIYLKTASIFGALVCFASMFFGGFDPWHSLDALVWNDLYGEEKLPNEAQPAFHLIFLMFSWLSVISLSLMFLIAKYALPKKEKWAYYALALPAVMWPAGASLITIYTGAYHYFISVAAMTLMLLPPVLLLFPYFKRHT